MLGPSTNVALAITLENNFTNHVNEFYIMGGSVAGIGNVRPNVEFNFAADPNSNFVLFNTTGKESQITLLSWETAMNTELTKVNVIVIVFNYEKGNNLLEIYRYRIKEWRMNVFGKYDSPYIKFINKIESVSLNKTARTQWVIADVMTATCMIEPLLIATHVVRNIDPVTFGKARGSILVDYAMRTGRLRNTKIVQKTDQELFKRVLVRYLSCEELPC